MIARIYLIAFLIAAVSGFVLQYIALRTPEQLRYSVLANLRYDTCSGGPVIHYVADDKPLYTYYFISDSVGETPDVFKMERKDQKNRDFKNMALVPVLSGLAGGPTGGYTLLKLIDKKNLGSNGIAKFLVGVAGIASGVFVGIETANLTRPGKKSEAVRAILADKKNWPGLHQRYLHALVGYTYEVSDKIRNPITREYLTNRLPAHAGAGPIKSGYLDYLFVSQQLHASLAATGDTEDNAFHTKSKFETVVTTWSILLSLGVLAYFVYQHRKNRKMQKTLPAKRKKKVLESVKAETP